MRIFSSQMLFFKESKWNTIHCQHIRITCRMTQLQLPDRTIGMSGHVIPKEAEGAVLIPTHTNEITERSASVPVCLLVSDALA